MSNYSDPTPRPAKRARGSDNIKQWADSIIAESAARHPPGLQTIRRYKYTNNDLDADAEAEIAIGPNSVDILIELNDINEELIVFVYAEDDTLVAESSFNYPNSPFRISSIQKQAWDIIRGSAPSRIKRQKVLNKTSLSVFKTLQKEGGYTYDWSEPVEDFDAQPESLRHALAILCTPNGRNTAWLSIEFGAVIKRFRPDAQSGENFYFELDNSPSDQEFENFREWTARKGTTECYRSINELSEVFPSLIDTTRMHDNFHRWKASSAVPF